MFHAVRTSSRDAVQAPSLWHEMLLRSNAKDVDSEDWQNAESMELVLNDDGLFAASNEDAVRTMGNLWFEALENSQADVPMCFSRSAP